MTLSGFVWEVFSGLSKLGFAAGQQEQEPERKRKLKR